MAKRKSSKKSRSRRRSRSSRCGSGMIWRKGYTRKDGTRVKGACIIDRGAPGKGPKVLPKLRKGRLDQFIAKNLNKPYTDLSAAQRHSALKRAVSKLGAPTVVRMLNAPAIYLKRTAPVKAAVFNADKKWVMKTFGGSKRQSRKRSSRRKQSSKKRRSRRKQSSKKRRSRRKQSSKKRRSRRKQSSKKRRPRRKQSSKKRRSRRKQSSKKRRSRRKQSSKKRRSRRKQSRKKCNTRAS